MLTKLRLFPRKSMDPQTLFKVHTEVGIRLQPLIGLQLSERAYWMVYTKINDPVYGHAGMPVQIPIIEGLG